MYRWPIILAHILFWAGTVFLFGYGFSIESTEINIIDGVETTTVIRSNILIRQLLVIIFTSAILFYSNIMVLSKVRKGSTLGKALPTLMAFLIISLLATYLYLTVFSSFRIRIPLPIALSIIGFYYAISLAYGITQNWFYLKKKQQALLMESKEVELAYLRTQLQPHFLFNALNNLLSMVDQSKNQKLAKAFHELSDLLRYVVDEPKQGLAPIQEEVNFINNYIAIQQLRFEENEVQVDFNIDGDMTGHHVYPGIFIPFVENAFKYGTFPESKTKINIDILVENTSWLTFKITNDIMPTQQNKESQTGIKLSKRRLNLLYPDKHNLAIHNDGKRYSVTLEIKVDEGNNS